MNFNCELYNFLNCGVI